MSQEGKENRIFRAIFQIGFDFVATMIQYIPLTLEKMMKNIILRKKIPKVRFSIAFLP